MLLKIKKERENRMSKVMYFTGGYTEPTLMGSGEIVPGRSKGIVRYDWNLETGELERSQVEIYTPNPSFVLADPAAPYVYCVNELKEYHEIQGSTVSAYKIEETGELTLINRQATTGEDACFLAFSPEKTHLIVANYSGGSVCVLPIRSDGGLEPASFVIRHQGSGPNPGRQEGPHPHQILLSPNGTYVYVPDLGLDRLVCYKADWTKGWLTPCEELDILGLPGQGIRHGVFDAKGAYLYVMTEMGCAVNVYAYEQETGKAELLNTYSALPKDCEYPCKGAAIRLHPNGKWLYVSVRDVNILVSFEVKADGELALLEMVPSGGEIPRDFVLSPDGRYLAAAHQDTDNICVFAISQERGTLTQIQDVKDAPCITVLAVK